MVDVVRVRSPGGVVVRSGSSGVRRSDRVLTRSESLGSEVLRRSDGRFLETSSTDNFPIKSVPVRSSDLIHR